MYIIATASETMPRVYVCVCVSKFARTEGAEAFVVCAHKSEAVAKYSYSALALGWHFCSRPVRFSTFFKPNMATKSATNRPFSGLNMDPTEQQDRRKIHPNDITLPEQCAPNPLPFT